MKLFLLLVVLVAGYDEVQPKSVQNTDVSSKFHLSGNLKGDVFRTSTFGDRYLISVDSARRNEAQLRCAAANYTLATVVDKKDLRDLKNEMTEDFSNVYWIGGLFRDTSGCRENPFTDSKILNMCWYWDRDQDEVPFYDTGIISFTDQAKQHKPARSSAMVIQRLDRLSDPTLEHAYGAEIHPFICDTSPSPVPGPPTATSPTTERTRPTCGCHGKYNCHC